MADDEIPWVLDWSGDEVEWTAADDDGGDDDAVLAARRKFRSGRAAATAVSGDGRLRSGTGPLALPW